jgi:hypothetical protein
MQDKRKELISKLTGLTDFSEESLAAERRKIQNELEELDPTIKERREEFEQLHGHKPKEEQVKISIEENFISLFERFKETYLIGLKVSTSLIDVAKYYDLFDKDLKILLSFAGFKSIKTKLETLREIKIKFLMSLGNAEQFIGLERNGAYKHPKPSTFVQTKKGIDGLVQRVEELNTNLKEPLIVARANKRVYEDIVTLLDREEEMILIELRNGKSLDYSPLNDKKDNGNPTTSATVENKNTVLSHREISLIYWYDRDILNISKKTSQKIAEEYGYKSKTSGLSLYNDHYTKVRDKAGERTDNATSEEYLNNIIPRLTTDRGKREANEDLKTAKDIKEKKKNRLFY